MSKIILFVAVMMMGSGAWAQNFAPIGAVWHYVDRYEDDNAPTRGLHRYESVRDTIIQGINCRKIEAIKIIAHVKVTPVYWDTVHLTPEYYYGTPDTVFRFNKVFNRFLPQFIFNVNVGDTVYYHVPDTVITGGTYNPSDSLFRIKITHKSNVVMNGIPFREIAFQPIGYYWWSLLPYREKIGFLSEFYNDAWGIAVTPLDYEPFLRCYSDSQIQYHFNSAPCDSLPTTDVVEINPVNITISPNPTTSSITIKGITQPTIAVYNLMGQKVVSAEGSNEVNLAHLPVGMYMVQVFNKDMELVKSEKIILNR